MRFALLQYQIDKDLSNAYFKYLFSFCSTRERRHRREATPDRVQTDIRQSRTSWRRSLWHCRATTELFTRGETTALYFRAGSGQEFVLGNSSLELTGVWLRRGDVKPSEPAGKLIKVASMLQRKREARVEQIAKAINWQMRGAWTAISRARQLGFEVVRVKRRRAHYKIAAWTLPSPN